MDNYYHILGVSSTASAAELEAAMDALYQENQQKARLTHNRDVADEANRMLRLLEEQIRPTLTDPARRAAYDAQLAEAERTGGLADPGAQQGGPILPPRPEKPGKSGPQPVVAPVDAWVCPQCGTTSPRGTRFCSKCRAQIGIDCPKCKKLTLKSDPYCAECGADLREELERERQEKRAQEAAAAIARAQAQIQAEQNKIAELEKLTTSFWSSLFGISNLERRVGYLQRLLAAIPFTLFYLFFFFMLWNFLFVTGIGAFGVLVILPGAGIIAFYLQIVILRRFARDSIFKEIQTHQDRIAQLEAEIKAISMKSVSQD